MDEPALRVETVVGAAAERKIPPVLPLGTDSRPRPGNGACGLSTSSAHPSTALPLGQQLSPRVVKAATLSQQEGRRLDPVGGGGGGACEAPQLCSAGAGSPKPWVKASERRRGEEGLLPPCSPDKCPRQPPHHPRDL